MSIYKAPQILILHLKRFKQRGGYRKEKNETKVQFPMILDITQHVGDPCPMESYRTAAKHKGVYITPKYEPI